MAHQVHQLSPTLVNKIAAGEVIVRPASVVKELIENSLDAGAQRIRIEIQNHCRDISIVDDGCGMIAEDAEIALQRHTTSKIMQYEDLENLLTRGFRGEALASIAAVSRMELISHHPDEQAGIRLKIEGGSALIKEFIGAPHGTSIKVRDLFYNTPARLKFLGTTRTETNHIIRLFVRQALSSPESGFALVIDDETFADLPPRQQCHERIVQLLGSGLADSLLPLQFAHHPLSISGFIARPEITRKDRTQEFFFINKRPISSRSLAASLEQAFKGYIMTRRFPVAVVFIEIEPGEVDVNVHPTKEEVRFTREYLVTGAVHRAVVESLNSANLTRDIQMPGIETASQKNAPSPEQQIPDEQPSAFFTRQMQMIRQKAEERRSTRQRILQIIPQKESETRSDESATTPLAPLPSESLSSQTRAGEQRQDRPLVLGQIADTYIVAESGDSLLIVDQHAAHERLLYERFKGASGSGSSMKQLMIPATLEIGIGDLPLMKKLSEFLSGHGIEVEHFGGQTFIVRSLPADIADGLDVESMIFDLLDDLRNSGAAVSLEDFRETIVVRMACRAAIKSGQHLSITEQQKLLDDIQSAGIEYTCPHGRPTIIRLTRQELDKQFKRK